MVDNVNVQDQTSADERPASFFATPAGRAVLIGLLVVALLVIAGVVYFTMFAAPSEVAVEEGSVTVTTTSGGSQETTGEDLVVEPPQVPLTDVFTFRDIFKPTVKPTFVGTETASSGGTTATGGSTSTTQTASGRAGDNTLYLEEIVSKDGQQVAIMSFDGQVYEVAEGDRIGDTPWQVLEISESSVVMLYGDSRVTLSVGQGMTK